MENPYEQKNIMSVAIQNDDLGTIQALLEAGVNPYRVPPPYGRSPMYWAMHGNKKAIIELFYSSGLRLAELVSCDMNDIHMKEGLIRVTGKGSKDRIIPIGSKAKKALSDWFIARDIWLGEKQSDVLRDTVKEINNIKKELREIKELFNEIKGVIKN